MAKYLSPEWHEAAKQLAHTFPGRPGADARLAYKVTGGPDGDIEYFQVVEGGKVLEQSVGSLADADLTLTTTWDDAVKVATGELDANAAFMQGRMKVTGNVGKLMTLLPLTMSPEYQSIQAQLQAATEY